MKYEKNKDILSEDIKDISKFEFKLLYLPDDLSRSECTELSISKTKITRINFKNCSIGYTENVLNEDYNVYKSMYIFIYLMGTILTLLVMSVQQIQIILIF